MARYFRTHDDYDDAVRDYNDTKRAAERARAWGMPEAAERFDARATEIARTVGTDKDPWGRDR